MRTLEGLRKSMDNLYDAAIGVLRKFSRVRKRLKRKLDPVDYAKLELWLRHVVEEALNVIDFVDRLILHYKAKKGEKEGKEE